MVRTARPRPARVRRTCSGAYPGPSCPAPLCAAGPPAPDVRVSTEHDLGVGREQILVGARKGRPQLRELRQHALRDRHVRLLALPPRLGVSRARRKEAWVEDDVVVVAHHYANVRVVDGALANERRRGHGVGGSMVSAHPAPPSGREGRGPKSRNVSDRGRRATQESADVLVVALGIST